MLSIYRLPLFSCLPFYLLMANHLTVDSRLPFCLQATYHCLYSCYFNVWVSIWTWQIPCLDIIHACFRFFFMAGLRSKYQPLCFTSWYLIFIFFLLFLLLLSFERLGQRISQTAVAKFNGSLIWCAGDNTSWYPHHMLLPFLENYSTNSRIVCGLWSRCSSSTKIVRNKRRFPHN